MEYHVKSGPFPVSYHRGRVEFTNDEPQGTHVKWVCTYTPRFFLGPVVSRIIQISFRIMLRHLARSVTPAS